MFEEPEEKPPSTLADLIKEDMKELAAHEETLIRVPGYSKSGLQVKYRLPESGKELDVIGRKVNRQEKDAFTRSLFTAIDTMIYLCEGLYVQPAGVDEPVMLDPEETGYPARFDDRLASLLGMNGAEPSTARQIVRRLFNGNDFAIVNHAERLNRWLMDTSADLSMEFWQLGE
jgi:hypothetical protein